MAAMPQDKRDLNNLLNYLKVQLAKSGVKVFLNKEATTEGVEKFAPDSVIVAIGSSPFIPDIPGVGGENVLTCREVLSGREVGKNVVILGGGYVGCETSLFLASKGVDVTLVFRSSEPALDVKLWENRKYYQDKLKEYNVKVTPNVQYDRITPNGIN